MNPWSFDYIVDGFTNVIVLFHTPWCKECQDLLKEFVTDLYDYLMNRMNMLRQIVLM